MPGPSVGVSTLVFRLARELRASLDRAFQEVDLTSQQAGLLIHIWGGQSSPRELAALLGVDTAGTTRLLDRLEGKGLVGRSADPHDRRAIRIALTPAGEALAPRLPAVFERVARTMAGDVEPSELTEVIGTMLANLSQSDGR